MSTMPMALRKFLLFNSIYYALFVFMIFLTPRDENNVIHGLSTVFYLLMLSFGLYLVSFIYGLNFQIKSNNSQLQIHLFSFILFIICFIAMSVWYPPIESVAFAVNYYPGNIDIVLQLSFLQTLSFYLGTQIVFITKYIRANIKK